jgi:hypothetical protein
MHPIVARNQLARLGACEHTLLQPLEGWISGRVLQKASADVDGVVGNLHAFSPRPPFGGIP